MEGESEESSDRGKNGKNILKVILKWKTYLGTRKDKEIYCQYEFWTQNIYDNFLEIMGILRRMEGEVLISWFNFWRIKWSDIVRYTSWRDSVFVESRGKSKKLF